MAGDGLTNATCSRTKSRFIIIVLPLILIREHLKRQKITWQMKIPSPWMDYKTGRSTQSPNEKPQLEYYVVTHGFLLFALEYDGIRRGRYKYRIVEIVQSTF